MKLCFQWLLILLQKFSACCVLARLALALRQLKINKIGSVFQRICTCLSKRILFLFLIYISFGIKIQVIKCILRCNYYNYHLFKCQTPMAHFKIYKMMSRQTFIQKNHQLYINSVFTDPRI